MNANDYIKLINSSNDEKALKAWSKLCKEYEKDPREEERLIKVHEACADTLMDILNKKLNEEEIENERTANKSSSS
tara:strand:+ start:187 stop:414 length:228 start_codon:yes stop_codon:yes gene_type:complete